jgi:hypothetical protein
VIAQQASLCVWGGGGGGKRGGGGAAARDQRGGCNGVAVDATTLIPSLPSPPRNLLPPGAIAIDTSASSSRSGTPAKYNCCCAPCGLLQGLIGTWSWTAGHCAWPGRLIGSGSQAITPRASVTYGRPRAWFEGCILQQPACKPTPDTFYTPAALPAQCAEQTLFSLTDISLVPNLMAAAA